MKISDRVDALLESVLAEERLRPRPVEEWARWSGESTTTWYRRVKANEVGFLKIEGKARKGHGQAGSVRIRLLDVVEWMVRNERRPGELRAIEQPEKKAAGGSP